MKKNNQRQIQKPKVVSEVLIRSKKAKISLNNKLSNRRKYIAQLEKQIAEIDKDL